MAARGLRARAIGRLCLPIAFSCALVLVVGHVAGAGTAAKYGKRTSVISVRGKASGLFPGASVPLRIKLRNRGTRDIVVTRITVRAKAAGRCSEPTLTAAVPRRVRLRVPARARVRATYPLRMSADAPNACQGAAIPLRFRVRARRA